MRASGGPVVIAFYCVLSFGCESPGSGPVDEGFGSSVDVQQNPRRENPQGWVGARHNEGMQALTARTKASLKAGTFNRANALLMVKQICRDFLDDVRDIRTCVQAVEDRMHPGAQSSVQLMDEDPPSQAALDYIDDIVAAAEYETTAAQLESAISSIEAAASATLIPAEAELVLAISSVAVSSAYEWEGSADEWQDYIDECLDPEGPGDPEDPEDPEDDPACLDMFPDIRVGAPIGAALSTNSITLVAHNSGSWEFAPTFASSSMAVQRRRWDHWRITRHDLGGAVIGGLIGWAVGGPAGAATGALATAIGASAAEFIEQLFELIE